MSDGDCPRCGAPLKRQTDRRKAVGYSLRCSVGGHGRTRRPQIVSQRWLNDPSAPVCMSEGCMADAGTCRHA